MRVIDSHWVKLQNGYRAVLRFEADLNRRSVNRLKETGGKKSTDKKNGLERRRVKLQIERTFLEKRFYREQLHWQYHAKNYPLQYSHWRKHYNQIQSRLIGYGLITIILMISVIGFPLALFTGLNFFKTYKQYRQAQESRPREPKPPVKPLYVQDVQLSDKQAQVKRSFNLADVWWNSLLDREWDERNFGSIGVNDLLAFFQTSLSDEYLAFRELLIGYHLDADVLILAPSGIWVLECKHLAGQISYHPKDGWNQYKTFYENGSLQDKDREFAPGKQWQREAENVARTVFKRLPQQRWIADHVYGGVAFTYPDAQLDIHPSCPVEWGRPEDWLARIRQSPILPSFAMDVRLQVADALIDYAIELDGNHGYQSAEALASRLYTQGVK